MTMSMADTHFITFSSNPTYFDAMRDRMIREFEWIKNNDHHWPRSAAVNGSKPFVIERKRKEGSNMFQMSAEDIEEALSGIKRVAEKNTIVGAGLSPVPDYLSDPKSLAKRIFDFWVDAMRSDSVADVNDGDGYDKLPEEMKEHFVETIQVNVTEPLQKFYQQLQAETRDRPIERVKAKAPPVIKRSGHVRCYTCDRIVVAEPGDICDGCRR